MGFPDGRDSAGMSVRSSATSVVDTAPTAPATVAEYKILEGTENAERTSFPSLRKM